MNDGNCLAPWTCRTVVCGPPVWPEKVEGSCKWNAKLIYSSDSLGSAFDRRRQLCSSAFPGLLRSPNDRPPKHGFLLLANGPYNCFPFHHSLMSETGLPLSPTWRTLRNHHHCHGPLSNQQPLGKRPGLLGESWLLKMLKTAWEIWRAPPRLLWLKSWMSNSVCLCLYLLARSLEKVCGPVKSLCVGEPWQP